MMPRTIDDNGSHPGTPTSARRGVISPLIHGTLQPPYWGWQLIGRQTPDTEETAAFGRLYADYSPERLAAWHDAQERRSKSIEYRGVVSDHLGTIVWESEWGPGGPDLRERTRGVAVHHNVWGCMEPGCEDAHPGQERWDV